MNDDYTQSFALIQQGAARLNALTDQMAATVQTVEHYLAQCHVGVSAHVPLAVDRPYPRLEYMRLFSGFRIALRTAPESGELTAWSDSARDLKIASFPHLPALLAQLTRELQARLEASQGAATIGEAIRHGLPAPQEGTA